MFFKECSADGRWKGIVMSAGEILEDYFPSAEVKQAKNYIEIYHGRFLLSDKLGRGDAVLLTLYMFCNKKKSSEANKNELKDFATSRLGIEPSAFSKGLSDLKSSKMVGEIQDHLSLSFKGLKKLREMFGAKEVTKAPTEVVSATEKAEIPSIGTPTSARDGVLRLLSSSWGRRPKNLAEIMDALEVNAIYYPKATVAAELNRMTASGILRRMRTKSGYAYVLAQKAKPPA